MNDVDFDELDKAVANAMAGGKQAAKPDLIVHSPQPQVNPTQAAPQDQSDDQTDASQASLRTDSSAPEEQISSLPDDSQVTPDNIASSASAASQDEELVSPDDIPADTTIDLDNGGVNIPADIVSQPAPVANEQSYNDNWSTVSARSVPDSPASPFADATSDEPAQSVAADSSESEPSLPPVVQHDDEKPEDEPKKTTIDVNSFTFPATHDDASDDKATSADDAVQVVSTSDEDTQDQSHDAPTDTTDDSVEPADANSNDKQEQDQSSDNDVFNTTDDQANNTPDQNNTDDTDASPAFQMNDEAHADSDDTAADEPKWSFPKADTEEPQADSQAQDASPSEAQSEPELTRSPASDAFVDAPETASSPVVAAPTDATDSGEAVAAASTIAQRPRGKYMDIAAPTTSLKPKNGSGMMSRLTPLSSEDTAPKANNPIAEVEAAQPSTPSLAPQFSAAPAKRDEEVSPFVPDVEVKKRPLGGFGQASDKPDEIDAQPTPDASEQKLPEFGPEMHHDIVSVEENEADFQRRLSEDTDSAPSAANDASTPLTTEATTPIASEDHFAFGSSEPQAAAEPEVTPEASAESSASDAPQSIAPAEPDHLTNDTAEPADSNPEPTPMPLLKSLPEQEVPAGGSIIQQHSGEMGASLSKPHAGPTVPLLSAENYHPLASHEHHTPLWVWILVVVGVLAVGALSGAALFMFNPGMF